jgi:hypothetical protein
MGRTKYGHQISMNSVKICENFNSNPCIPLKKPIEFKSPLPNFEGLW